METIQKRSFFIVLLAATVGFVLLIRPFWPALFWAIIFAIIFNPLNNWWIKTLKQRQTLASVFSILSILIIVFLPLSFLISLIINQAGDFYVKINNWVASGQIDSVVNNAQVLINKYGGSSFNIDSGDIKSKILELGSAFGTWLLSQVFSWTQNTFKVFIQVFVMLYVLIYLFNNGKQIVDYLVSVLPIGDKREKSLFNRFADITRSIFKGTMVIALIQGVLGALLFWSVGIAAPAIWGVVMTIFSLIPALGPAIVWFPAGLILLFTGNIVGGVVILAVGFFIISLVDNLLRPFLVGKETGIPNALVVVSMLSGISVFGISGVIVGPVITGLLITLWGMFKEEYSN